MRSRGPPSASSTVSLRRAESASARSAASAAGPAPSDVSARIRAPGCRCGRIRSSGRPCSESSVVSGSGQPSRAAARLNDDGAGTTSVSLGSTCRASSRADAVEERIARGEHADRPPALLETSADRPIERARPRPHRAADQRAGQLKMALAAEHDLGVGDQPARDRRQALDAVLADADDGQPAARCGSVSGKRTSGDMRHILILGGTSEARQLAGRLADRRDLKVTLSLAGRTAHPAAQPVPVRVGGFGGAEASRPISRRAHRRADRCDASLCRDDVRPMRPRPPARANVPLAGACGGRPGPRLPGDRWIEVDDVDGAVAALGDRAAPRVPRHRPAGGRRFAAAPQHDYLVRSVDPVDPPLDVPHATYIVARGPFSEDDERALLQQHRIEFVVAKNSGGDATYGKIAAARALGIAVIMLRRPALPDVPAVETVEDAVAWLDHPLVPSVAERGV